MHDSTGCDFNSGHGSAGLILSLSGCRRYIGGRRKNGRKRAKGTRAPLALPEGPNMNCSLGFVSDALAGRQHIRILAIVDDSARE